MVKKNTMKYTIITPVKNEASYIRFTLESVTNQSLIPLEWIIVDDGSTDETLLILREFERKHDWIKVIENKTKHEKRSSGAKVVRAFYVGYQEITNHDYEFIVKLDADLILPENYFEQISIAFHENYRIGLCGGYCVTKKGSKLIKERTAKDHIRGPIKAYRKQCFEDIGGLKAVLGWDGLDEMTARYLGWEIKQMPLQVIHLRETRKEYNSLLHRFNSGMLYFRTGYGVILTILKMVFWGFRKPFVVGGIIFAIGYLVAFIKGEEKFGDKNMRKFFRRFKYGRIVQFLHLR